MNDVFERLSARMNNNEIFERLSARLDNSIVSSKQVKNQEMRASHAARVAEMEKRHANDVADIDSWWNEVCEKHAAAEAAMDAKHKEAQHASKQVSPAAASSIGNNEQANRLFGEQHRLFMEQVDRNQEQASRLFHQ